MNDVKCEDVTKFEQRLKDEIIQWKEQREKVEAIYDKAIANLWKKTNINLKN